MKIDWNRKYTTIAVYACIVILFAVLCIYTAFNFKSVLDIFSSILSILNPIIYGFVIAFLINPIYKIFDSKVFKKIEPGDSQSVKRRVLALIAAYLVAAILISCFVLIVVPQLVNSYNDLESHMGVYISNASKFADKLVQKSKTGTGVSAKLLKLIKIESMSEKINDFISDSYKYISKLVPYVTSFVSGLISVLKNAVIGIIVSIYMLYSKDKLCAQLKKTLFAVFKKERVERSIEITRFTSFKFQGFLFGKIIDSIIIGIIMGIILTIFRVPYSALIAVIVGVTNIIPFFGPIIGAIPSSIIVLFASPIKLIPLIIIIIVIQQFDGNILQPMILGDRIGLSAIWIITSLLLMGGILGVTGFFIGVPIFAVIYSLFADWVDKRLVSKGMPSITEEYYQRPDEVMHARTYDFAEIMSKTKNKVLKAKDWIVNITKKITSKIKNGSDKKDK